jgi:hypothetical protein
MRCDSVLTVGRPSVGCRLRQRSQYREDPEWVARRHGVGGPGRAASRELRLVWYQKCPVALCTHNTDLGGEILIMKKKLTIMAAVVALLLLAGPVAASHLFPDVPTGSPGTWARERHDAVDLLVNSGIVTGYPDGTFKGDNAANRNQFALWMARAYDAWIACPQGMSREIVDVYVEGQYDDDPELDTGWQFIEVCTDESSFEPAENGQPLPVEAIGGR